MSNDAIKYSELIRRRVNVHGELHLDVEFTQLLIGMIEHLERSIERSNRLLKESADFMSEIEEKLK